MSSENNCPAPTLSAGDRLHGFRVLRVEMMQDIRVTAYELEHEKTGAKVLHLHCDDRENLYAVGFRTPPADSTGVPHILEHAVLAGSEKFPLKDAFNELHKGTLQTFINAFTYPDKTIYPVASQVRADFYNLARVYTDLVLRPRLLRESFYQEGHHLELADPGDRESDLVISGIVYNEMKGAYSSPDTLMAKAIQENLFPDNTYAYDSGGDPEVIPQLTYEQFKAFHRTFYSPGNARIFLYGDIPTSDHLEFLAEMLAGFEKVEVESSIPIQEPLPGPVYAKGDYPLARGEKPARKTTANCAWLLAENTDVDRALLIKITCAMLVGSSAGPLRKALIDSRLGEDLSPVTGLEEDFKQMFFAVGLRGTDPDKAPMIEEIIFRTLQEVYEKGFDSELVEGTIHQVEFHGKEIVRTALPYGIVLMGAAFHTWLYDGDPLAGLDFHRAISAVRKKWEENPAVFQEIVKEWLIDNRHRVFSVLEPSVSYLEEREETYRQRMARLKAALTPEELDRIKDEAAALHRFQAEPDPPEAAATLPRLKISELSREIDKIPTEESSVGGIPLWKHDIFTNGIAYLDAAIDISDIPENMQACLPLLGKLTVNMGAAGLDYEAMAKRIALKAGGISFHLVAGEAAGGGRTWQKMIFRAKCLYRNVEDTVKILTDIFTAGDLSHRERMYDLIAEKKNNLSAAVVRSGHIFAMRAAAASLTLPSYRDEQWHGRTQLRFIDRLAGESATAGTGLKEKLVSLREMVFRRDRLTLNITADVEGLALLSEAIAALVEPLPGNGTSGGTGELTLPPRARRGIIVPAQVSYVAQALKAPGYTDDCTASLLVAAKFLSNGYLYKRIRVQGGAYGGTCQYDPLSGLFAFLSYRDPHIVETLNIYSETPDFLAREKIDRKELDKAVISTIGALDRPMDPSTRGFTAMIRKFAGLDEKIRLDLRLRILDMQEEKLLADSTRFLAAALKSSSVVVLGEESRLAAANEVLETKLDLEPLV